MRRTNPGRRNDNGVLTASTTPMYHPTVIDHNIGKIEAATGVKLLRHSRGEIEELLARTQDFRGPDGSWRKPLGRQDKLFVQNEQILAALDFEYYCSRYHTIEYDGAVPGGFGLMQLGGAQRILLDLIAKVQLEQWEQRQRDPQSPCDGILIADHKARQVWHTALVRALAMHRAIAVPRTRSIAISVDADKIHELWRRDQLAYENLPFYLKKEKKYEEKDRHIEYEGTGSRIEYMEYTQKGSLGQSQQFDLGHLTECSECMTWASVELDFLPTLPQSPNTLCILESRANGRGNGWHLFSESVRKGQKARWRYCFIPYYAEPLKYRRQPPADWKPSEEAIQHAKMVYETSAEWVGKSLYLTKQQLYWWETTRREYLDSGALNFFLTNYCATPQESFQHSNISSFRPEVLEMMRARQGAFVPYKIEWTPAPQ